MPLKRARLRISDYNENRKNKLDDNSRKVAAVSLSLTSMVDMFAILVIFLLSSNSTVQEWVQIQHDIQLPKAKSSDEVKKSTTIQVSKDAVFGEDNQPLIDVAKVQGGLVVGPIQKYLSKIPDKQGYVNIVADARVPFGAMRRIIATVQESGFNNVNLAVMPRGN